MTPGLWNAICLGIIAVSLALILLFGVDITS
jgi:hypothetical protein